MVNDVTASLQPSRGGLAALLGFKPNPVTDYIGSNRSALLGLAAGLAGGPTWGQGMSNGFQMAAQGGQMDQQQAEKLKAEAKVAQETNATKDWLAKTYPQYANLPPAEGFKLATEAEQAKYSANAAGGLKPIEVNGQLIDPTTFQVLGDFRTVEGKGGNSEVALQPTWLQDASGKWVIGQLSKDGSVVQTKLPDGLSAADPGVVAGTKAGATVDAKTAGAARAAMRGAEVSNNNTAKAVAEVRANTRGMNEWFGQIGPRGVYINPGSEMGKFWAAAEPTNNQGFMQAREMLKGGGQITDYEGRKAEDAFSRMRASLEKGDQEQYLRALADFEEAVALGYQKLVETANSGYATGAPAVTGNGGNRTSTGVTYTVEP